MDADGHPLPIDPAGYVEDWGRLTEKCIDRRYPLDDGTGRTMGIRLTVCDSGGEDGVTKRGYDYWRQLNRDGKGGKFRLVKGRDSGPSMIEAFPESRGKAGATGDVPVLMLNTDALKDVLAADLARTAPGPGYWHIPAWMDAGNVRELTAEVRTNKGWRKATAKAKNESVDLCVYGEGAYARLQGDRIDWRAPPPWAAEWDSNSEVSAAGADVPKPITRRPLRASRSSYMQG